MSTHAVNPALAPSLLSAGKLSTPRARTTGPAFADQLAEATRAVQVSTGPAVQVPTGSAVLFSGHATERLAQRGVSLDASQMRRLEHSVSQAASKGSRSALVLVDRVAMIVAVPERTVVTAMPTDQAGQGIFTNIDAAVVA
jgi:flagellar operon protein